MSNGIRGRGPFGPGDSSRAGLLIRQSMPQQPAASQAAPSVFAPPGERARKIDFYVYDIDFDALAADSTANGQIQIQADSDFELQKLTHFTDIGASVETEATRVLPLVTLQITDTGTGRQMFSQPVPIPAIMGDGRIPFILSTPKLFTRNASVSFQVSNYSAATIYNLRLQLIGAKIFAYG
jgi:hypothetical protein